MVKHIVSWTLKEDALLKKAELLEEFAGLSKALLGKIEGLLSIEMTSNILETTTIPSHIVLQSTHTSKEALDAYAIHPEHLKLGALIKEVVTSRTAIDYEI